MGWWDSGAIRISISHEAALDAWYTGINGALSGGMQGAGSTRKTVSLCSHEMRKYNDTRSGQRKGLA